MELIHQWTRAYTSAFLEQLNQSLLDAKSRLITVAEGVVRENLGRFDMAVRSLGAHEPGIAPLVRHLDKQRLAFARQQFEKLVFQGADLTMRARTFMAYYSRELSILVRQTKRQRFDDVRRRAVNVCAQAG